jgi:hypothetical protein
MSSPRIDTYRFGYMVVDGKAYTRDLVLLPDRVVPNWWCKQGHVLDVTDLEEVLAAQPDVLVVGTGAQGAMMVPDETRQAIAEAGIELRVARSSEASELYNELRAERRTAGAFHLTC